jgi:hypothetical protein
LRTPPKSERTGRLEPRELLELRRLRTSQPELAEAVDLHIALFEAQRRIMSRVSTPWIEVDPDWWRDQQARGRPLLRFKDIPINWNDFRLILREVVDILRRFGAIEEVDVRRVTELSREGDALAPVVQEWYETTARLRPKPGGRDADENFGQAFVHALRPFLARCVDVMRPRLDLSGWTFGYCPLCGGDPEFSVVEEMERKLACGRCGACWKQPDGCPFCGGRDLASFATPDRKRRVDACNSCRRYVKTHDAKLAARPLLAAVDAVLTLPLDAAAMQRGYSN